MTQPPDFRDPAFLDAHIRHTMAFYHPRCIDRDRGGFFHFFKDDGTIYDADTRHLVSSTRFVFNYAMAFRRFGDPDYQDAVRHGLAFLRDAHRNPATGGYAWLLGRGNEVLDGTNHCYGLAFVVLAYAKALEAGIEEARGAPRRDLAAHGAAFLVRGRWALPRRDQRRLDHRLALSRPERQHAQLRGHARGL